MSEIILTDAALHSAAEKVRDAMLDTLPPPSECNHVFSEPFIEKMALLLNVDKMHSSRPVEQRIRKLKHKANHPFLYGSIRRIAAIILVVFLGLGLWLTVDNSARAIFIGWIKETYEMFFVYRYSDEETILHDSDSEMRNYRPTWIPEGYKEYKTTELNGSVTVQYIGDGENRLRFSYISGVHATNWFVDTTDTVQSTAYVNGREAELFISQSESVSSILMWTADNQDAFYVCGFVPAEDLIRMAESVVVQK